MVELSDIEIGQTVYWITSNDDIRSGFIDEITIKKDSSSCLVRSERFSLRNLYLTHADADIELSTRMINEVKKEILKKADTLKKLRARKSDALAIKLSQIEKIK